MDTEMVERILNEIYRLHPWTQENDAFFSGNGHHMQWLEGEIAIKMFAAAVREGIPMVNIHDAYAVNHPNSSRTKKLMNQYRDEVLEAYRPVLSLGEA